MNWLGVAALFFFATFHVVQSKSKSNEDADYSRDVAQLITALLKGYQPYAEPAQQTSVKWSMSLLCEIFDPNTRLLTSIVWEDQKWNDSRFTWNPSDFSGIDYVHLPASAVWTPDIVLLNSVKAKPDSSNDKIKVSHNGELSWYPQKTYTTFCTSSTSKGNYNCHLMFGSWTYTSKQLSMATPREGIVRTLLYPIGETCLPLSSIEEISVQKDLESYKFIDIEFKKLHPSTK